MAINYFALYPCATLNEVAMFLEADAYVTSNGKPHTRGQISKWKKAIKNIEEQSKIAKCYYEQLITKSTKEEYQLWLNSLPKMQKLYFQKMTQKDCENMINFKRFRLELQDEGFQ